MSNICFGLSLDNIHIDTTILSKIKIAGFDFILLPENYEPSTFIPFIQDAQSLGLLIYVKLGIFLDVTQAQFAKKFLNLDVPEKFIEELKTATNPLEVSIKFAKEYIDFLKILGFNGLFLILPQNEKNLIIKKRLFTDND